MGIFYVDFKNRGVVKPKETKAYFQALGTHMLPFRGSFGFTRTISQIPDVIKRSEQNPNALTSQNLLANDLESSAVHEVEKTSEKTIGISVNVRNFLPDVTGNMAV